MTNQQLLHYIKVIRHTLIGRYGVDTDTANEAVYRAFVRVWDKDYDPQAFLEYFTVASKNQLLNMLQHRKRYALQEPEEASYQQSDHVESLDQIESKLPDVYVRLFRMLRKGMALKDIALELNKSYGAVRTMKTRMIKYCQAVLVALMLCVLLPSFSFGQTPLESMEIVKKAGSMYFIMVEDDTVATRRDDHKVAGDLAYYAQRAKGKRVWYTYTEVGELEYSYIDTASISVNQLLLESYQTPDSVFVGTHYKGTQIDSVITLYPEKGIKKN